MGLDCKKKIESGFIMLKKILSDKRNKTVILIALLILFIFNTERYFQMKKDMYENWIYTTATIESRELYSTSGDDYKYKYGIVYSIKGEEYHSYLISTYGSVFDIGYKIRIYVNPKDYQEVKYDRWETFKD